MFFGSFSLANRSDLTFGWPQPTGYMKPLPSQMESNVPNALKDSSSGSKNSGGFVVGSFQTDGSHSY